MPNIRSNLSPKCARGYIYDAETQLYYCQSRYYDPATGRFLNADALTSTGQGILGNNMFAYCGNNPICYADNSGYRMEYIDAEMVAGGIPYILDQKDDSVATKQFGLATVLHGGCGVIASYNALITLGDPKSFDDVLGYYNSRMGFTLGAGLTGLYPNSVAKYFYSLGYEVIVTDQKSRLDELSQTADASIMYYEYPRTYWLFPAYGAHFVEYHRSNHIYEGVNTNGLNGRSYFSTPSEFGYSGSRYYVVGIFIYK